MRYIGKVHKFLVRCDKCYKEICSVCGDYNDIDDALEYMDTSVLVTDGEKDLCQSCAMKLIDKFIARNEYLS